jgi:hypothetical protein
MLSSTKYPINFFGLFCIPEICARGEPFVTLQPTSSRIIISDNGKLLAQGRELEVQWRWGGEL